MLTIEATDTRAQGEDLARAPRVPQAGSIMRQACPCCSSTIHQHNVQLILCQRQMRRTTESLRLVRVYCHHCDAGWTGHQAWNGLEWAQADTPRRLDPERPMDARLLAAMRRYHSEFIAG